MNKPGFRFRSIGPRHQRGVATLVITLVVLVILTIIVLSSSNVALFEQKTATNENRQRLADQAAEYSLRLAGEYFKGNIVNLVSAKTNGWLASGTSHWTLCSSVTMTPTHPCMSEPSNSRRAELYFYRFNNSNLVPWNPGSGAGVGGLTTMGGTAAFPVQADVTALLCRIDTTLTPAECRATPDPESANRIAVTLVSKATMSGENAVGEVKETWANFDTFATASAVPLVASGFIDGTGNVEIVANAHGAGNEQTGPPVSIWSASDADVDKTGGGSAASISTCFMGEFRQNVPLDDVPTTCPAVQNACGCPAAVGTGPGSTFDEVYAENPDFLSGKIQSTNCCEGRDILDVDGNKGEGGKARDNLFFPGSGLDKVADLTDDSLFEWIFFVENESETTLADTDGDGSNGTGFTKMNCGDTGDQNCAIWYLTEADQLGAESITCADLNALGANANGLYYINDSSAADQCDLPTQVGTPEEPAIVVVNERARLNNTLFYGMLFVRSDNNSAYLRGNGQAEVYGSVVVQGSTDITGGLRLVYWETAANGPGDQLPESTRLGRVSGSWLDNARGGF
jgi:hypothetical protein